LERWIVEIILDASPTMWMGKMESSKRSGDANEQ
jgi:hypothetical protein